MRRKDLSPSLGEELGLTQRSVNRASSRRARSALDICRGISGPHSVPRLDPCVPPCGSAVHRVNASETAPADGAQHTSVVGAKGTSYLTDWLAARFRDDIRSARQLFMK